MGISLFVGKKTEVIGGMQTHLYNVIKFMGKDNQIDYIIYKYPKLSIYDCINNVEKELSSVEEVMNEIKKKTVIFFNDGWWIEEWTMIRKFYSDNLIVYRTGGNEFVKAPYKDNGRCLEERQNIWSELINECIDFVISNSRYTSRRLQQQDINYNKILTIRGGVNIEECQYNYTCRSRLRKEFDTVYHTENKIIFAIVSRFERFKGIMDVLEAFSRLKKYDNYFLLFVGNGTLKNEINNYCNKEIASNQYCILPEMNNTKAMQYIALADYYLNCSKMDRRESGNEKYIHTETMGRSLYEAIYQYVPVIATKVGGIPELYDEFDQIGLLIDDVNGNSLNIIKLILDGKLILHSCGNRFKAYGWEYITSNIYASLVKVRKNLYKKNIALCLDIDGTLYHQMFSEKENIKYIEMVLQLSEQCEIIINSAANYKEILDRYPIFDKYKHRITIVSNCGKHLYLYGREDEFWKNYMSGIPGIQTHIIQSVCKILTIEGIKILSFKYIDKLYINIKIKGKISSESVKRVNYYLENTEYMIVHNNNNIKLISKIVNKAAPIKYLKELNKYVDYWIGAGNNVLDFMFMDLCDKSYGINCHCTKYEQVCIKGKKDMLYFVNMLKEEIGEYI